MRVIVASDAQKSIDAMWHAYRASPFVAQNCDLVLTSVVQALLNARYYNSAQGQFLSEDPVFWGEPKQQNLGDPQSLDTYSYSADNPITKKDPSGKCLEDGCVVEATALGGFAGGVVGFGSQYVSDVNKNVSSNGLSLGDFYKNLSSPSDYANSTGKGVIVGGATALSSIAGLGYYLVGITAGGSTAVTDYLGDLATHKKTDWGKLAWDSAFNGVTGGAAEFLPGIPGRLPNLFSNAFFTGAHAQSSYAVSVAAASAQLLIANSVSIATPQQLNSLKSALQSLSAALASYGNSAARSLSTLCQWRSKTISLQA